MLRIHKSGGYECINNPPPPEKLNQAQQRLSQMLSANNQLKATLPSDFDTFSQFGPTVRGFIERQTLFIINNAQEACREVLACACTKKTVAHISIHRAVTLFRQMSLVDHELIAKLETRLKKLRNQLAHSKDINPRKLFDVASMLVNWTPDFVGQLKPYLTPRGISYLEFSLQCRFVETGQQLSF